MRLSALLSSLSLSILAIALTGCSVTGIVPPANIAIHGNVHGGQQAVIGATIKLWAAGTMDTSGVVTPPRQLLQRDVITGSGGAFSIADSFQCPTPNTQVYLTASGGNPGVGVNNPQLVLMSLLGACSSITPSTFIFVNEETTVIAAEVTPGILNGAFDANDNIIDVLPDNGASLAAAFPLALEFVNPATGAVPDRQRRKLAATLLPKPIRWLTSSRPASTPGAGKPETTVRVAICFPK